MNVLRTENLKKYYGSGDNQVKALDGISLTVAKVTEQDFQVSVIPHTRKETALSEKRAGSLINIECDVVGKYIEKLISRKAAPAQESRLTEQFLSEHGFL